MGFAHNYIFSILLDFGFALYYPLLFFDNTYIDSMTDNFKQSLSEKYL